MENPGTPKRTRGLSRRGLRLWGMLFLTAGIVGRSIFQKELLGLGRVSGQELLELMGSSENAMVYATLALILQAVETCAVPIFAFLLLDGFQHTSAFPKYLLKVTGAALLCEIPYNLAMSGSLLDTGSRNPMLGLVVGLILLYLYNYYGGKSPRNVLIKILVAIAALLWVSMLRVEFGVGMVIILCVLWVFRKNQMFRNLAGVTASIVCTLSSPFFLAAPMGFMVIHFYNGEPGTEGKVVKYLVYPILLLVIGLAALAMRQFLVPA